MNKENLKKGFDEMLGASTIVRRKRNNTQNIRKQMFISIIQRYEESIIKSVLLNEQYGIDVNKYEDPLFNIIDDMMLFNWGDDIYKLIEFYIYDRIDIETGEEYFIQDDNGEEHFVRNPTDLFELINKLYPNIIT